MLGNVIVFTVEIKLTLITLGNEQGLSKRQPSPRGPLYKFICMLVVVGPWLGVLVHSHLHLVTFQLGYCNALYMGLSLKSKRGCNWFRNGSPCNFGYIMVRLYNELYWFPLDFQVQFKVQVVNFKDLHGLIIWYLKNCLWF